jgi:hypothetical protein
MHSSLQLIKVITKVCTCPLTIAINMHKNEKILLRVALICAYSVHCISHALETKLEKREPSLRFRT